MEADRLFFEQIEAELIKDETLQTQAKVNGNGKWGRAMVTIENIWGKVEKGA